MKFDEAFDLLVSHEGGYVFHPKDPGGETKYGISKRSYPGVDIKAMNLAQAKAIYLADFWNPLPKVSDSLRFHLFDCAVNSGVSRATRMLQSVVGVDADGQWGAKSRAAYAAMDPKAVEIAFSADRLLFMASLPTWPAFGRGWARRIASNLKHTAKEIA